VTTDVDIEAEIDSARRLRDDLESESRRSGPLGRFTKAARSELGAAGTHVLAERAEKLRDDWVRKQLVDAGRARAQALGWPDAYAFTKALGERALVAAHADVPITVVRPRSSNRPWPSPGRAGSGASGWPSPSSSPTPGDC
jgi:fatty acyl-CoA reductase